MNELMAWVWFILLIVCYQRNCVQAREIDGLRKQLNAELTI